MRYSNLQLIRAWNLMALACNRFADKALASQEELEALAVALRAQLGVMHKMGGCEQRVQPHHAG